MAILCVVEASKLFTDTRRGPGLVFVFSLSVSLSTVANLTTIHFGLAWHTGRQTCYIYAHATLSLSLSLSQLVHSYYTTTIEGSDSWLGLAHMQADIYVSSLSLDWFIVAYVLHHNCRG